MRSTQRRVSAPLSVKAIWIFDAPPASQRASWISYVLSPALFSNARTPSIRVARGTG